MCFPFPSASLLSTGDRRDPREPRLAEHTDVWECEEQPFRENEEQEGQMAGMESRKRKRKCRGKRSQGEAVGERNSSLNPLSSNPGAEQFLKVGIRFLKGLAVMIFPNMGARWSRAAGIPEDLAHLCSSVSEANFPWM